MEQRRPTRQSADTVIRIDEPSPLGALPSTVRLAAAACLYQLLPTAPIQAHSECLTHPQHAGRCWLLLSVSAAPPPALLPEMDCRRASPRSSALSGAARPDRRHALNAGAPAANVAPELRRRSLPLASVSETPRERPRTNPGPHLAAGAAGEASPSPGTATGTSTLSMGCRRSRRDATVARVKKWDTRPSGPATMETRREWW